MTGKLTLRLAQLRRLFVALSAAGKLATNIAVRSMTCADSVLWEEADCCESTLMLLNFQTDHLSSICTQYCRDHCFSLQNEYVCFQPCHNKCHWHHSPATYLSAPCCFVVGWSTYGHTISIWSWTNIQQTRSYSRVQPRCSSHGLSSVLPVQGSLRRWQ